MIRTIKVIIVRTIKKITRTISCIFVNNIILEIIRTIKVIIVTTIKKDDQDNTRKHTK